MGLVVENSDTMEVSAPIGAKMIEPLAFMDKKHPRSSLVILNQRIEAVNLHLLWNHTHLHVCADGGANRLYEYWESTGKQAQYIPDFIVGDLDSLRPETRDFYRKHGTIIVPQYTQYASDFMKAINLVQAYYGGENTQKRLYEEIEPNEGLADIIQLLPSQQTGIYNYILNGLGGRFDQTVQSVNQLFDLANRCLYLQSFFVTSDDIVFLVRKGTSYISYSSTSRFGITNPVCGLLPLKAPVVLTTRGLKWDVQDWESSVGGRISSSNALVGQNGVSIDSSDDLVVNIEMHW